MPTFVQINFTIGSTTQFVPLTLCMSMHKRTLVLYVYITFTLRLRYVYVTFTLCFYTNISLKRFGSKLSYRTCWPTFRPFPPHFSAPVRWFGHFSCVTFSTFVACLVHFCRQVQQFGHFCHFPAVAFFCAFACCTSIFADRRKGLATFSSLH